MLYHWLKYKWASECVLTRRRSKDSRCLEAAVSRNEFKVSKRLGIMVKTWGTCANRWYLEPTHVNWSSLNFFRFFFNWARFFAQLQQSCSLSYLYLQFKIWFVNSHISIFNPPMLVSAMWHFKEDFYKLLFSVIYFRNKKALEAPTLYHLFCYLKVTYYPLKSSKTYIIKGC